MSPEQALSREAALQRSHWARKAATYDAEHSSRDEHGRAAAWLAGAMVFHDWTSLLEVGAGTGRILEEVERRVPGARCVGVEPVDELRAAGHRRGLALEALAAGDGYALEFEDASFDVVAAFAVLHHVRRADLVVDEMLRVARNAIFISDCNNFGHGTRALRWTKNALRVARLWRPFRWTLTRGRGYDVSDGEGVSYSYSVFTSLPQVRSHCTELYVLNTQPLRGSSWLTSASHVALLGLKKASA